MRLAVESAVQIYSQGSRLKVGEQAVVKVTLVSTTIVALAATVVLSLPQHAQSKSSKEAASALDPLVLQEEGVKDSAKQKRHGLSKRDKLALASKRPKRSELSESYYAVSGLFSGEAPPGLGEASSKKGTNKVKARSALSSINDSATSQIYKTGKKHSDRTKHHDANRTSISYSSPSYSNSSHNHLRHSNIHLAQNNNGDYKNIFESSARTAGKVATAPARAFRAAFISRQPKSLTGQ